MKVGFCQIDIITKDIEKNVSKVEEMIKRTKSDIIVLPEFFNTGISFVTKQEAELVSEDIINGNIVKRLKKIAAENNTYLIGALVEKDNEHIYLICHTANIDEIATFDMCKDRAKEAGAYFISCNRIGSEKNTKLNMDFIGRSSIIDRNGNVIVQAGDKEEIKVIDILNKKGGVKKLPLKKNRCKH